MAGFFGIFGGRSADRDRLKVVEECSLHGETGTKSKGITMAAEVDSLVSSASTATADGQSGQLETYTGPLPQEGEKFDPLCVEKIIKDHLDAYLYNVKYEADRCTKLAHDICLLIKDKTKELRYRRYKLVTQVLVGQDSDQSVHLAARCLWNHRSDNFAAATYRNSSIYAVGIVYGMYLE